MAALVLTVTYATVKDIASRRSIKLFYVSDTSSYAIYVTVGDSVFQCSINKDGGANQTDFETNYKASAIQI